MSPGFTPGGSSITGVLYVAIDGASKSYQKFARISNNLVDVALANLGFSRAFRNVDNYNVSDFENSKN